MRQLFISRGRNAEMRNSPDDPSTPRPSCNSKCPSPPSLGTKSSISFVHANPQTQALKWPALTCVHLGAPHPDTALRRRCSHPGRYMSAAREPPWCSWHRASSPHGQQHMGPPLGTEVVRHRQEIRKRLERLWEGHPSIPGWDPGHPDGQPEQ